MRERRKHTRQGVQEYLTVYDCSTGEPIGRLANLSSEGAMFVTSGPVKATAAFRCRVELVRPILGRDEILFDAECRWCRKNVKRDRWESGYALRMTGIDADLVSFLTLSFKLGDLGAEEVPDITVVEMENRRKSVRYEFEEPLKVYEQQSYRQIGQLADLSTHGIRLITRDPVSKDDLLQCRVLLPRKVFRQEYLVFDAKCMWCRRGTNSVQFESGYEIVNISDQDVTIILHLLIHYADAQQEKKRVEVIG
jgi:hypothetical protein